MLIWSRFAPVADRKEASSGSYLLYETTGATNYMHYSAIPYGDDAKNLCCFDFECYEVAGRLTFEFSSKREEDIADFLKMNEILLLAFAKALGRRCYEFYRGSRSKKQLVEEMQKVSALEAQLSNYRYCSNVTEILNRYC